MASGGVVTTNTEVVDGAVVEVSLVSIYRAKAVPLTFECCRRVP